MNISQSPNTLAVRLALGLLVMAGAVSAEAATYQYRLASKGTIFVSPRARTLLVSSASPVLKYNIFSALGNPSSVVDVTITIASGTLVTTDTIDFAALSVGALPSGSTVTLINNGIITGAGGLGGSWVTTGSGLNPQNGGAAISLSSGISTSIDNTSGYIFGGGGGGLFGTDYYSTVPSRGGGGGGAGGNGVGGLGTGGAGNGKNGSNGLGGTGGGGGSGTQSGGSGGGYGQPGNLGYCNGPSYFCVAGAAGLSIFTRGAPLTFTKGNNSTQVKGAIN